MRLQKIASKFNPYIVCGIILFYGYCFYCYNLLLDDFQYYKFSFHKTNATVWKQPAEYFVQPSLTDSADVDLIVLVASRPESISKRKVIRDTWGGQFQKHPRTKVIFIFGLISDADLKDDNRHEFQEYKDLLVPKFEDTYHNLSLKSYLTFDYAITHYKNAQLFLKADDDVMLYTENILDYLKSVNRWKKAYYGHRFDRTSPYRDRKLDKYYAPYMTYPGRYYPSYCSGHAYIGTRSALECAVNYIHTNLTYYLHFEDILLTGLVAKECNSTCVHSRNWHPLSGHVRKVDSAFSVHYMKSDADIVKEWSRYEKHLQSIV